MPRYRVTDPATGQSLTLTGDSPPTEAELEQVFAGMSQRTAQPSVRPMPSHASAAPERTWADRVGATMPDTRAGVDMLEGAASGVASTVFHGGDLFRRLLGMQRVVDTPEAQRAMRAPAGAAGTIGKGAEQAAEFAYPLSKVSESVSALSWLSRMAAEGAASAGIAGVQSGGDTGQMAIAGLAPSAFSVGGKVVGAARGAVGRMAAGAREGGVGGALANVARQAAPVEPARMIVQALKPRNSRVDFGSSLGLSLPEIKAVEKESGKAIQGVDDLLGAVKTAKKRVWSQYEKMAGPKRAMGATVDLSPVADAMESSIPAKARLENANLPERVKTMAAPYRTRFSIDDTAQLLRDTNAELESYYNKFPSARRTSELANPETALLVAQAKILRQQLNAALDASGDGAAVRAVKQRYGALLELEDAATRRANVAARQQPESLSEQIGKVRAAADMAKGAWRISHGDLSGAADIAAARAGSSAATFLKEQQTTDALIRRAMASHTTLPTPIQMPTAPRIAGHLPPASVRVGPGPDRSFVRGVPAQPAVSERLALPPRRGTPMPAAPDASYVRAVPGEYAKRDVRGLLPAKSQGPTIPASGRAPVLPPEAVKPDASGARVVPAAPLDYEFVPARGKSGRESWRQVPKQYSSDPAARPASRGMAPSSPESTSALKWIQADMDAVGYSGKNFNEVGARRGGDLEVGGGSGGAPIYQAIVGNKMSATRAQVQQAITELLDGTGKPSKLKQSILEVADDLARGDKQTRKLMQLPPSSAQSAEEMARSADEVKLKRFTDELDALRQTPGEREPGEDGQASIRALLALGGGSAAAAAAASRRRAVQGRPTR